MDVTKLPTLPATLRPHHALCLLFFEGKGYNQNFIERMTAFMADPSRLVQITGGCDILCHACPHNLAGVCDDEVKVTLFDQRVLNLSGEVFQANQPQALITLCQSVYETILQQRLLVEVCGECEWAALCQGKWQRGDFNRYLLEHDLANDQPD